MAFEIINKLRNPSIVLVIFLTVADEDVIIISFNNA